MAELRTHGLEQCEIVAHAFYYDMDLPSNTFDTLDSLREDTR